MVRLTQQNVNSMNPTTHYGAFNARWIPPEDVARGFVPISQFRQLVHDSHSILLGPRGCGKTTLLKMLTREALETWIATPRSTRFESAFDLPSFSAIYIPADTRWAYELRAIEREKRFSVRTVVLIQRVMVISNALTQAILFAKSVVETDVEAERDLSHHFSNIWSFDEKPIDLDEVALFLSERVTQLRGLVNWGDQRKIDEFLEKVPPCFYAHCLDALIDTCKTVAARISKARRPKQWAFCFDELEIAPSWLKSELMASLRSIEQGFFLKLTGTPVLETLDESGPAEMDDFKPIRMWHSHVQDPKDFCESLASDFLHNRFKRFSPSPKEVFGTSAFSYFEGDREDTDLYDEGSSVFESFKELAGEDKFFREFLEGHGIDSDRPKPRGISERNTVYRKVRPLVMLRKEFRDSSTAKSRKRVTLYAGKETIYAMSEGNPRWLLGLLNDLCDLAKISDFVANESGHSLIPYPEQAKVLASASRRFCALMKAIPTNTSGSISSTITLFDFLDRVAHAIQHSILSDKFSPDPPGSFKVEEGVSKEYQFLIEKGVEEGALVFVGQSTQEIPKTIIGNRFRLTFLMAPSYKLPMRNLKSRSLGEILQKYNPNQFEFPDLQ